jgi:hypothetical protein
VELAHIRLAAQEEPWEGTWEDEEPWKVSLAHLRELSLNDMKFVNISIIMMNGQIQLKQPCPNLKKFHQKQEP